MYKKNDLIIYQFFFQNDKNISVSKFKRMETLYKFFLKDFLSIIDGSAKISILFFFVALIKIEKKALTEKKNN